MLVLANETRGIVYPIVKLIKEGRDGVKGLELRDPKTTETFEFFFPKEKRRDQLFKPWLNTLGYTIGKKK